jgi:hypothetical protein
MKRAAYTVVSGKLTSVPVCYVKLYELQSDGNLHISDLLNTTWAAAGCDWQRTCAMHGRIRPDPALSTAGSILTAASVILGRQRILGHLALQSPATWRAVPAYATRSAYTVSGIVRGGNMARTSSRMCEPPTGCAMVSAVLPCRP